MSRLDKIIELIISTEQFEQNRRAQTIQKGALALLLRENVRYQKNNNVFTLSVNGVGYTISKIYLEKYLGQSSANSIANRNLNQAIDLESYNYQNIQLNFEDDEEKQLQKMEESLSSLYGDVVDNNRILSSLTENKRLRDENANLKRQLDEAYDVIEMLKAELDKFNILMIRSRNDVTFDEEYSEIHNFETNDVDEEINDEDNDIVEEEEDDVEEFNEEDDDTDEYDEEDDDDVVNFDDIMTDVNMDNAVYNDDTLYQQPEESQELEEENSKEENFDLQESGELEEVTEEEQRYGIFPYKEEDIYQMAKQEFVFNYAQILVRDNEDNVLDSAEITIVPLITKVHYPRILVSLIHNGESETLWFKNAKSGVDIDCGSFIINLKAKMSGPNFKTFIRLANENFPYKISVETRNFDGSIGHIYLNYEDKKIHICPVNFKNNEDDLANFIYCIEEDEELVQCGDNSEGEVYIEGGDEPMKIMAKWVDNSLFGTISY